MRRVLLLVFVAASALTACNSEAGDGKVQIVASFYPVAYAAQRVGGDLASVRNLTPAGVEPHDLELTSGDLDRILDADAVLYVGSGFQPAVAAAARKRDGHTADVAAGLVDRKSDPHFWLDPTLMREAVARVRAGLIAADPRHASTYKANAAAYEADLAALDAEYRAGLAHCARREIVTAHAAFHYLAKRYGLEQFAVSGVSPESEPDPQRVADLADRIHRDGVTTVFYEELVPRTFADTLARETGARAAVLSPLEGLTKQEQAKGDTYLTVMRRNLAALIAALDCRPA